MSADKFNRKNLFACNLKVREAVLINRKRSNILFLKAYELNLAPLLAGIRREFKLCLLSFNGRLSLFNRSDTAVEANICLYSLVRRVKETNNIACTVLALLNAADVVPSSRNE